MKLLLAQPANLRFQWELEVLLTNLKQFDVETVLLFTEHDFTVPGYLADKYGVECFAYSDRRNNTRYVASIKPWLIAQWLREDPRREQEQYFYIDSDIIFREWPRLDSLGADENTWVGSDCGAYLDYNYLLSCEKGQQIIDRMADICEISLEQMQQTPGIGAQVLITNPTADWWDRAYQDANRIYDYLLPLNSNIQKWTAGMWAELWGMVRAGKTVVAAPELDFCRPHDNVKMWDLVKILHNAGVIEPNAKDTFFKGAFSYETPFGKDFDYVRRDRCSIKYVEAIKAVR